MPVEKSHEIDVIPQLLPYHQRLAARDVAQIDLIVIHCTELPDLATAREYGERILYPEAGTGASGHYYIDRDGAMYQYVPDDRVAHHVVAHNDSSIGIELVNLGRYPDWYRADHQEPTEAYPEVQIESLIALIRRLKRRYPHIVSFAGHADLDVGMVPAVEHPEIKVRRKIDPGPLFPWNIVLERTGLPRLERS